MKLVDYLDKTIRWSFYTLLFLVPLILTSNTSELFELNKMWLTWGLTIIITASWLGKMALERKFYIRRTPLDIPILLFLLSQIISTIFSLDQRVSFWGYYSRFNGGLLSFISYTLLYYAFVSNSTLRDAKRFLYVTLLSSVIVVLWGFPSHFGYDPTCLLFRGNLDTSCWTESFKPTIRIFSTLGQPAWMAAYLAVLLPITMAVLIWEKEKIGKMPLFQALKQPKILGLVILTALMYLDLLYTDTRAGFIAFWVANGLFWLILFFIKLFPLRRLLRYIITFNVLFLFFNFTSGTPIPQLDRLSLRAFHSSETPAPTTTTIQPSSASPAATTTATAPTAPNPSINITDSGVIRLLVWKGAIAAWKDHPLFGTGVETYAFAYYKYRPAAHNLTSEWDYLYNKAHNEYLNYLATTGAFGLGTHILILIGFFYLSLREILKIRNKKASEHLTMDNILLIAAFPGSMAAIMISNFFGFSVVIINLFTYFIPLWLFFFSGMIEKEKLFGFGLAPVNKKATTTINPYQWTVLLALLGVSIYLLYQLIHIWNADVAYALGSNYDHAGDYQAAYPNLIQAVQMRPAEPVFKDELSVNLATLGTAMLEGNNATSGAQLAQQAIQVSNDVVTNHPNNVVFWKSRVRVFYLLAQVNPNYYQQALQAVLKAQQLAPTDAKIAYNVGVLYGQNNQLENAIDALTKTIALKPDYRDAYYARGLFYHQLSQKMTGPKEVELYNKGVADLRYILTNLVPNEPDATKVLESWGETVK